MRWFKEDASGVGIETKEWAEALKDVEDLERMTRLGRKVYADCVRLGGGKKDASMEGGLMAFAHVLHHMMDNMDEEMWANLRWAMEGEWKYQERTMWESPENTLSRYASLKEGKDIIGDLERIGVDLQMHIRPNIVRLVFAMLVADGRKVDMASLESADPTGRSLLAPMAMLDRLMAEGIPEMLDEEEAMGLWHLSQSLLFAGPYDIETDEVMAAIQERRYFVSGQSVRLWLYMHSREGTMFTAKEVAIWRTELLQAVAMMMAFKVMLVAATIGESGPLHPDVPGPR